MDTPGKAIIMSLTITFALNIKSGNPMSCGASLFTSIPTKRCPRNELEWNTRAALFNCSSINQTCVKPDKFEYHCVLNENVTGLVEVCAPSKHVFEQKCLHFHTGGKLIQESVIHCSSGLIICPNAYRSTEAYKYQSCYEGVIQEEKEDNNCCQRIYFYKSEPFGNSEVLMIAVFIFLPLCTLVTLVSFCLFIKYYRKRRRLNRHNYELN
uniref:Uncharacterized protein LOC111102981 n=1 Tax=Crassostrea virginica TaxID=6565 RepID=A0A8B8ANG2_CRAVI|nr:uncharacterized protein LOC111102981 [Crassostrea virginica]XP_022291650.1 uncharacterized protein LOC111102981 [Crassostrea virginica]